MSLEWGKPNEEAGSDHTGPCEVGDVYILWTVGSIKELKAGKEEVLGLDFMKQYSHCAPGWPALVGTVLFSGH